MKMRLLATDSDPALLGTYRGYFSTRGFEVVTAADGLECLELLREFQPDALILSLELTWGGAEGILAIVREDTQMRPIPVVLTVNEISQSTAVRFLRPPVVKLLQKPLRLLDLEAIVEATLRSRAVGLYAETIGPPDARAGDNEFTADDDCSLTEHTR